MNTSTYTHQGWQRILLMILPYFIIVGGFQYLGIYLSDLSNEGFNTPKTTEQATIVQGFTLLGTTLVIALFLKFVDKKPFADIGLHSTHFLQDSLIGTGLGLLVMAVGLVMLLLTDQVQITSYSFNAYEIVLSILLFVIVSLNEELLIRGYVLQNLMLSFNKYVALILSSALFSVMHLANPNVDWVGILSLFLAGLLLGLCYLRTGSLWLPIALHFSWNFFQSLLGFNVSGMDHYSIFHLDILGVNNWNGGSFGLEGSILSSLLQLPALWFVYAYFNRKQTSPVALNSPVSEDIQ